MSTDADEQRARSAEMWEEAAAGWAQRQDGMRAFAAPVSHWLIEAIEPQPGQRLLELAAGIGETGFLAAELVRPGGTLISSDRSEGMLEAAKGRAAELGLDNVEFKVIDAEWIDLPVASVDAVLCRWGYMLMADPGAALRETRRVVKPDGHLALAVWAAPAENPWLSLPTALLIERGAMAPPAPDTPGPFALSDPDALRELLEEAGLQDVVVDAVDLVQRHPTFEDYWQTHLDLGRAVHDAIMSQPEEEIERIRAELRPRLEAYAGADGALAVPGRTLVASARA